MTAAVLLLVAGDSHGHAFGARYDLPLPLALYLWAAGAAVALSFVVAGWFLRRAWRANRSCEMDLAATAPGRLLASKAIVLPLRLLAVLLLALVIVSGLVGVASPTANFSSIFVWVIWWVGMTYASALLGNVWDAVNPWRALALVVSRLPLCRRAPLRRHASMLGVWPALALFAVFCYLEIISDAGEHPPTLAWLVIGYTLVMVAGSALFGRRWIERGDAFTVLFGILARFGIMSGSLAPGPRLLLRPPGFGLLDRRPVSLSLMAFVILALTAVTFDGFLETPAWAAIVDRVAESRALRAPLVALQEQGLDLMRLLKTVALLAFYVLFLLGYLAVCVPVARWSGGVDGVMATARAYVLTLVPIAIAYHLAHYLSYLLLAGQLIISVASDPFGFGWDLFGTAERRIDITVIGARQVWYVSVLAIVTGHVIAVCLAHATALRRAVSGRRAVIGQLPLVTLMVAYTMISLWILSQPIVASG